MSEQGIHAKALIFIAIVFAALVGVLLWSNVVGEGSPVDNETISLSRVEITKGGEQVPLDLKTLLAPGELEALVGERARLLLHGDVSERQATAIHLNYMTNSPEERYNMSQLSPAVVATVRGALLKGLNDADALVSNRCREALVGLWRGTSSLAAAQRFDEAVAAYEAVRLDAALAGFHSVELLRAPVPPDLYRLEAEVYLTKRQPDEAIQAAGKALEAEPMHFLAVYALARALEQKGESQKALRALDAALTIYKRFPEAEKMRAELLKRVPAAPPKAA